MSADDNQSAVSAQSNSEVAPNLSQTTELSTNSPGTSAFLGQTQGDFIIKNFRFNDGEVLPELRLHYVTLGTTHRNSSGEIDNAVLLLHSTGGDTTEFFEPALTGPLYGPGEPLDLNKFFLIIPDDVGTENPGLATGFEHTSRITATTIWSRPNIVS